MSKNKNPLKDLSEDEISFLRLFAKIYVQSMIKQAEQQNPLLPSPYSRLIMSY